MNGPWNPSARVRLEQALVYGLGLSGRAAARLLLARGVAVLGGGRQGGRPRRPRGAASRSSPVARLRQLPPGVDLVVVSPGVPLDRPLLEDAAAAAACR